jgi:hypothetical protein
MIQCTPYLEHVRNEEAYKETIAVYIERVHPLDFLLNRVRVVLPEVFVRYIAADGRSDHSDEQPVDDDRVEHYPYVSPDTSNLECQGVCNRRHLIEHTSKTQSNEFRQQTHQHERYFYEYESWVVSRPLVLHFCERAM